MMTGASGENWNICTRWCGKLLVIVRNSVIIALALLVLWLVADILLVIFGGILLGILLRALSDWLGRLTGLPAGWSVAKCGLTPIQPFNEALHPVILRFSHGESHRFSQIKSVFTQPGSWACKKH